MRCATPIFVTTRLVTTTFNRSLYACDHWVVSRNTRIYGQTNGYHPFLIRRVSTDTAAIVNTPSKPRPDRKVNSSGNGSVYVNKINTSNSITPYVHNYEAFRNDFLTRTHLSLDEGSLSSSLTSIVDFGLAVLNTPDLLEKVRLTIIAFEKCSRVKDFPLGTCDSSAIPSFPSRPLLPRLVRHPPSHKQSGVSLIVYMMHQMAHIELTAIDMYWDTIVRFQTGKTLLPEQFYLDIVSVTVDEARHFYSVLMKLRELGSDYGAVDSHEILWQNALMTSNDLTARLALVPLVQEARGLDAGPRFISKFLSLEAFDCAQILQMIVDDEIKHVKLGMKWYTHCCTVQNQSPMEHFHSLIHQYIPTGLIPPFNEIARAAADMGVEWYQPLVKPRSR